MVPRSVVILIVLVLLGILIVDVGGQFIPGSAHQASPVLDGGLLTLLGMVLGAARGPKPSDEPDLNLPVPPPEPPGGPRHRAPEEGP